MNDGDIALKFNATIHILFVFGRIIILIIRIPANSKDPRFGTICLTLSARVYLQCFDAVGWSAGRASGL